jgi:hypothetical protein
LVFSLQYNASQGRCPTAIVQIMLSRHLKVLLQLRGREVIAP